MTTTTAWTDDNKNAMNDNDPADDFTMNEYECNDVIATTEVADGADGDAGR